jgi:tRNA threonylcarbamoyladenosine biosynthesis protein TsaE
MDRERIDIYLRSPEETEQFGYELAHTLGPNTILALQGDLGAGKTTFVQGLAKGLGVVDPVQSPTFTYLQIYEGASLSLYHFDLYRLEKESDFVALGFEETFDAGGIVAIEWPDRIASLIPSSAQEITFAHAERKRTVSIKAWRQA